MHYIATLPCYCYATLPCYFYSLLLFLLLLLLLQLATHYATNFQLLLLLHFCSLAAIMSSSDHFLPSESAPPYTSDAIFPFRCPLLHQLHPKRHFPRLTLPSFPQLSPHTPNPTVQQPQQVCWVLPGSPITSCAPRLIKSDIKEVQCQCDAILQPCLVRQPGSAILLSFLSPILQMLNSRFHLAILSKSP